MRPSLHPDSQIIARLRPTHSQGASTAGFFGLALALAGLLAGCGGDKGAPITPPAGGKVFYVNADGSSECGSLQGCLNAAADGDTVEIGPGYYGDVGDTLAPSTCSTLAVVTNAVVKSNIYIRAARGAEVLIDGHGEPGRVGMTVPPDLTQVTFDGITFQGCWAGIGTAGGLVHIVNCNFSVGEHGLEAHETVLDVKDCRFENHNGEALNLRNCTGTIQRVTVAASGTALTSRGGRALTISASRFGPYCAGGVQLLDGGDATLRNCTIAGTGRASIGPEDGAILVNDGVAATIELCIVANNGGYGIACVHQGTATVRCSDFFANSSGNFLGSPDQVGQLGNVSLDPGFCSDLEFYLSPESPVRTAACGAMGASTATCPAAATSGPVSSSGGRGR